MSKQNAYIGKIVSASGIGRVKVLSAVINSRTLLNVLQINRGEGYDEVSKKYKGVKTSTGWYRGENREFGKTDTIHLNTIEDASK